MPNTTTSEPSQSGSLLFSALSPEDRIALMALCTSTHFPKRKTIFANSTPGDTVLLIDTGRVEISLTSANGKRSILTHLGPGDVVGELAVLDGQDRSADAIASTDVTGRVLRRAQLLDFLRTNPNAAIGVIEVLCHKLRETNQSYASHVMADGHARLARVLVGLFAEWGIDLSNGTRKLGQRFSQSELGDLSGLTRETVNRYLRDWEDAGILVRDGTALILLIPEDLVALANDT